MNIKHSLLAAAAILVIAPATAFAADESFEQIINVTAVVPNAAGLVVSDPTGWTTSARMSYDARNNTLNPISETLEIKSPEAITAYLSYAPQLSSATGGTIPLGVQIDGRALGTNASSPVEIAAKGAATAVKPINVRIARTGGGALVAGNYTGTIGIMFESTIP